jgi:hypothetical protein
MKTVKFNKKTGKYKVYEPKHNKPNFPEFNLKLTKLKNGVTKAEYETRVLKGDYYLEVTMTDKIKVLTADALKKSTDRFNFHVQNQRIHANIGIKND